MATRTTQKTDDGNGLAVEGQNGTGKSKAGKPRSAALGDRIISTRDFASFMSALVGDIVSGRIDPNVANAACKAGGQLLRVVEIEHKYRRRAEVPVQDDRAFLMVEHK